MGYNIELTSEALADLKALRAFDRAAVLDTIERILRAAPTQTGQSRIKRLRGLDSPQYRLRVGEFRVFYDVAEEVRIYRVLAKSDVDSYLRDMTDEG